MDVNPGDLVTIRGMAGVFYVLWINGQDIGLRNKDTGTEFQAVLNQVLQVTKPELT